MNGLGERLRALRESTMMSQAKFAIEIGSSQSASIRAELYDNATVCELLQYLNGLSLW